MTDTQPDIEPVWSAEELSAGLTWLMSLKGRPVTEPERRRALGIAAGILGDPASPLTFADLLDPGRGAHVHKQDKGWHLEWDPEAPSPLDAPARALWPYARELYRLALMQAGFRLAILATASEEGRDIATLAPAAARVFAVLDEAAA